ncbi:Aminoglycoside phosphotransferase domain-containing protein OS=Streptomyces griseomycini OX=66895 GN=FHS37_003154 PE=4 SV=1 [Streptomyces griseomycini]|nr:hypothetical protein GCM10015536_28790 [Streptomyces griseomycini]
MAVTARPQADGLVRQAVVAGSVRLARSDPGAGAPSGVPPVFGPGDGSLADCLGDGRRVRVVDFEDSGLSDRPFESAEITGHVGCRVEHPPDAAAFPDRFDPSRAETARLRECRRLLALVWLFLPAADDPENPGNPPGTAGRQADRLSELPA